MTREEFFKDLTALAKAMSPLTQINDTYAVEITDKGVQVHVNPHAYQKQFGNCFDCAKRNGDKHLHVGRKFGIVEVFTLLDASPENVAFFINHESSEAVNEVVDIAEAACKVAS